MTQSPLDKLFNPENCVRLGALFDVKAIVDLEAQDTGCWYSKTECTWRNIWSRRFCRVNTGGQGPCDYANKILFGIVNEDGTSAPPLVDKFVPRLTP